MTLIKWPLRFEAFFRRCVPRALCPGQPSPDGPVCAAHRWLCCWYPGRLAFLQHFWLPPGTKNTSRTKPLCSVAMEKQNICISRAMPNAHETALSLPGFHSCELFFPAGPAPPQTPPSPASPHLCALLGWE